MHKYSFIFLFFFFCLQARGQQIPSDSVGITHKVKRYRVVKPPFSYIGFSSGINNPSGLLGFDFEIPVKKYLSLCTGLGFSSWGNKLHLEGKYFFIPGRLGWALDGGLAFNSGVENFRKKLEIANHNTESITINMHPVTTVYLGVCRYWRLGNRYNRFFTSLGIDLPISPPQYQIIYNGPMLAEVSDKYLKHREPGGLMLGFGFLFGLHH